MVSLAEPRRKTKMSFDPNNKTWQNDETKFGKTLMKKMGWSDGDGLGKERKGTTSHLKVKVKNNSLGLGADKQGAGDEAWQDLQAGFNNLLENLTNAHTTGEDNSHKKATTKLEDKTNASKRRFYGRFVKSKDVSNYTDHDMNQILGKRDALATKVVETTTETIELGMEISEDQDQCKVSGLVTTTNTVSMTDYFAKRLAERRAASSVTPIGDREDSVALEIVGSTSGGSTSAESSVVTSDAEEVEEEASVTVLDDTETDSIVESKAEKKSKSGNKKNKKEKKSKKEKSSKKDKTAVPSESVTDVVNEPISKKEKSRKRSRTAEDVEEVQQSPKKAKKAKKDKKHADASQKKEKKASKEKKAKKSKK